MDNKNIKKKKRNNKKHQVQEPQKVQSFGKSYGVIPYMSNPGIGIQAEAQMWSHHVTGL
jgi:hypothetical protein